MNILMLPPWPDTQLHMYEANEEKLDERGTLLDHNRFQLIIFHNLFGGNKQLVKSKTVVKGLQSAVKQKGRADRSDSTPCGFLEISEPCLSINFGLHIAA